LTAGGVAHAQQVPWLFAGGTTDVAAIIDMDDDGPDPVDDCYFKFTGTPGLSGAMTIKLVDASGMTCSSDFPCFGTFSLTPGVEAVVNLESCTGTPSFSLPVPLRFTRPGPPPFTSALFSPNTAEITVEGTTVEALVCDANGLAFLLSSMGSSLLFDIAEFFPSDSNPTHLKIPNGGDPLLGGDRDAYIPLFSKKITAASLSDPTTTTFELDLGQICDCSLGGVCFQANPAPVVSTWGLAAGAMALLILGAVALRRRRSFASSLPLP
jgi:hypothetical protein